MLKRALPWLFLLAGWIALASYICCLFFCSESNATDSSNNTAAIAAVAAPAVASGVWNYNDGAKFSKAHAEYFKFPEDEFEYVKPLSGEFSNSIEETSAYLRSNPGRQLTVIGYYRDGEENTSILPNMGLARAGSVKSYMQSLGVPASQLLTKGLPIEGKWFEGGVLTKGIDFSFAAKSATDGRIPAIASRLVGKPLTLYFQTNQNTLTLSESQRSDLADMFYYIDNVPSSRLAVSGHTDNVGARNYNVRLSQDRATFVKEYLVAKGGVDGEKLNVQGMGPDKPIMSNDSSEGRSKNRRVEITLE